MRYTFGMHRTRLTTTPYVLIELSATRKTYAIRRDTFITRHGYVLYYFFSLLLSFSRLNICTILYWYLTYKNGNHQQLLKFTVRPKECIRFQKWNDYQVLSYYFMNFWSYCHGFFTKTLIIYKTLNHLEQIVSNEEKYAKRKGTNCTFVAVYVLRFILILFERKFNRHKRNDAPRT